MAKSLGERELAVIRMAEEAATRHTSLAMGPNGPSSPLRARYVDFRRSHRPHIYLKIAMYGGLVIDVQAKVIGRTNLIVTMPGTTTGYARIEGTCIILECTLEPNSTRPGGYTEIAVHRFMLGDDGYIHVVPAD